MVFAKKMGWVVWCLTKQSVEKINFVTFDLELIQGKPVARQIGTQSHPSSGALIQNHPVPRENHAARVRYREYSVTLNQRVRTHWCAGEVILSRLEQTEISFKCSTLRNSVIILIHRNV